MEIGSCAFCVVGDSLEARMETLRALGYDFIEPAWRAEEAPSLGEAFGADLRRLGERTGCPVRSAILGTFSDLGKRLQAGAQSAELDTLARAAKALAAAGGDVILLPNWAGQSEPDYDDLYVAFLREAGERAGRAGVKLGIEHIPGSRYRNTAAAVFDLVERVDSPRVGVYYDIANNLYIDDDPVAAARVAAPRVVQYHVKGYPRGGRSLADMPLREVKAIIEAAGYRGRVCAEIDMPEGGPANAHLAEGLATLRAAGF